MPVMQWGAVAAAVTVVAVAVVMQSPRVQQPAKYEQLPAVSSANRSANQASADKSLATRADKPARPPSVASAGKVSERERDAGAAGLRTNELREASVPSYNDELAKKGAVAKQKKEDSGRDLRAAAPSVTAPAPPSPVVGSMVAQAERNEPLHDKDSKLARRPAEQQPAAAKPAAPATAIDSADAYTYSAAKAAPSPASSASGGAALYGPGYAGGNMAPRRADEVSAQRTQLKRANLRWTVTSDGRVQRSSDGRNWIDVPIVNDKNVKFRALASDGDEVWAGGARGVLYYSADAGSTWRPHPVERVNGDIIRLNVNGKTLIISTSSGQTIQVSHDVFGIDAAKPPSSR
jgi:hypothetical protein